MFERFTEAARRAVFFGRYQASKFGSRQIEPYHLLLGVVQASADGHALSGAFEPGLLKELEREFEAQRSDAHISTSVDMPLSIGAKRALAYAGENAELRRSIAIDLPDVLAGLIQEDRRVADAMSRRGIDLRVCREQMTSASPEGRRARIDRVLDGLPPERMAAAERVIEALERKRVRIAVEGEAGSFTIEF